MTARREPIGHLIAAVSLVLAIVACGEARVDATPSEPAGAASGASSASRMWAQMARSEDLILALTEDLSASARERSRKVAFTCPLSNG